MLISYIEYYLFIYIYTCIEFSSMLNNEISKQFKGG